MIWDELREEEFEGAIERSGGLCVIPLGCTEKHGQHLPLGTDYIEAMSVITEAAKMTEVVILPTAAWLGEVSCFHSFSDPRSVKFRGCIGIKQETILTALEELCFEVARNGFKKILLVNCHGGNTFIINTFLRRMEYEKCGFTVMSTFALDFKALTPARLLETFARRKADFPFITKADTEAVKGYLKSGWGGGHGDFRETALIMAVDESLVATERYDAEDGLSSNRTDYLREAGVNAVNSWLANHRSSYEALPPFGCSRNIGRVMTALCAERLKGIFDLIKNDGKRLNIATEPTA